MLEINEAFIFSLDVFNHVFLLSIQSEDLFSLIESHEGKPLKLYVYNYERLGQ